MSGELFRLNIRELLHVKKENRNPAWPQLTISHYDHQHRRPGFLDRFSDSEYLTLYERLKSLKVKSLHFHHENKL